MIWRCTLCGEAADSKLEADLCCANEAETAALIEELETKE
jgi:hypothetical protein